MKVLRYRPNSETLHELIFPWLTKCGHVADEQSSTEEGKPTCARCAQIPGYDFVYNFDFGFGATVRCFNKDLIDKVRSDPRNLSEYENRYWPYGYKIEIYYPLKSHNEVIIVASFDHDGYMNAFVESTVKFLAAEFEIKNLYYDKLSEEYYRLLFDRNEEHKRQMKSRKAPKSKKAVR